jgi:DNA-binding NarL/FixJ family response regulator
MDCDARSDWFRVRLAGGFESVIGLPMIRILLADDHAVVRRMLRCILSADRRCEICAEAADGEQAVMLAGLVRPAVVILDVFMPLLGGIEAARRICALHPDSGIAVVTMHDTEEIERAAVAAGARAFLAKSDVNDHLLPAVWALAERRSYFMPPRRTDAVIAAQHHALWL